jgi:hypothetical protein
MADKLRIAVPRDEKLSITSDVLSYGAAPLTKLRSCGNARGPRARAKSTDPELAALKLTKRRE